MDSSIEPLMTTQEVASLLRKRPRTLESWRSDPRRANSLPFVRIEGQPRYRRSDVQTFIESNIVNRPAPAA
jgi:hypothetical protein